MKKLVTLLILLAAAGGGAYYYYTYGKPQEKPTVVQATISQGNVREIVRTTGTLEPLRTVPVGSQVSGVVQELFADFNDVVKAGQVIAKIDPTLLNVQVQIQEANVARQQGEIASQEVQLEQSKTDLKRTQELFDKGLANQQQLDQANLTLKTRMTSLDSAKKQLLTNQANLDQAKLNVSYTTITSPIDGVVINRQVDRGQTVQSSMNVAQFFTLATELQNLKLTAGVDEAEIGKIKPGMTVTFTVDAYQGQTFRGSVENVRLNAQTQNNVVTYPVWINAPNPDLKLRPSMTANITIEISAAEGVTRIPNQALRFRPTSDMYTALGLTPPAAGQGRALNAGAAGGDAAATDGNGGGRTGRRNGRQGGADAGAAAAPGAPVEAPAAGAAPARGQGQPGQGAQAGQGAQGQGGNRQAMGQGQPGGTQGRGGQPGGQPGGGRGQAGAQGFGGGQRGNFANMTPEERQRMMAQFGGGRGGAGGGRGGRGGQQQGPAVDTDKLPAGTKIDSLFAGVPKRITNGNVWMWDEANKKLTEVRVSTGITDGQFSELISGDVKVGQQVVTSIILPVKATAGGNSNLFGGQQGGRGGGLQPGGGGPGGGGPGGFGGGPGGGGGGFGGGGGGGGRGGGN